MLKQNTAKANVLETIKKRIAAKEGNVMNREDRFMLIYTLVETHKLRDQFDAQIAKMRMQSKHRFKDMLEVWEYAYDKVRDNQHR